MKITNEWTMEVKSFHDGVEMRVFYVSQNRQIGVFIAKLNMESECHIGGILTEKELEDKFLFESVKDVFLNFLKIQSKILESEALQVTGVNGVH